MTDYFVNADVRRDNPMTGAIVAKVTVVLSLLAVLPNAPPQYTGPTTITDLIVGVGRQLQFMDPDGDPVTVTVKAAFAQKCSVTPQGVLVALVPLGAGGVPEAVEIELDDGKP